MRWSARQRELGRLSIGRIRHGHVKPYEQTWVDCDYLDELPPEARTWMANYLTEAHGANFPPGERHVHPPELRREVQARVRSRAGDRRPDMLAYRSRYRGVSPDDDHEGRRKIGGQDQGERGDGHHSAKDDLQGEIYEAQRGPPSHAEDDFIAELDERRQQRWADDHALELQALADARAALAAARRAVRMLRDR